MKLSCRKLYPTLLLLIYGIATLKHYPWTVSVPENWHAFLERGCKNISPLPCIMVWAPVTAPPTSNNLTYICTSNSDVHM